MFLCSVAARPADVTAVPGEEGDNNNGSVTLVIHKYETPPGAEKQHVVQTEDLERYLAAMKQTAGFKEQLSKCLGEYKIPHGIIVDVVKRMRDFGKYHVTKNNCQIWVEKLLSRLEIQVPQDQPDAKTVVEEIIEPSLWTAAFGFAGAIAKFVLFK
ncbi:hypothetical protein HPB52_010242 [Rhipicephalus sanguineus]|uniref:Uncharacterized protein n=1 Tax=Rhipicephalus sanguineus TaxID=34632 RepID=A0A9D4PWQ5_RHISA|nr:hypothetical protein HPB52_010242 [Rhipicephalus sanguineus]